MLGTGIYYRHVPSLRLVSCLIRLLTFDSNPQPQGSGKYFLSNIRWSVIQSLHNKM